MFLSILDDMANNEPEQV